MRLYGKTALITGGASGLGAAMTKRFVAEGAAVVIADIDNENGEALATELGPKARFITLDVTQESDWQRAMDAVDTLDCVINNAGITTAGNIEQVTLAQFRHEFEIDVVGVFLGCKYAVAKMKQTGGSIINMSSLAGIKATADLVAYNGAKAAVAIMTKSIAAHCGKSGYGIRCNSIHPAGVLTPMVIEVGRQAALMRGAEEALNAGPITKLGEPDDIAYTVLFLASDESKFINGAAIRADDAKSVIAGNA